MNKALYEAIEKAGLELRRSSGQLTAEDIAKELQAEKMKNLDNFLYTTFQNSNLYALNHPKVVWLGSHAAIEITLDLHVFHLLLIEEDYLLKTIEGETLLALKKGYNNFENRVLVAIGEALRR